MPLADSMAPGQEGSGCPLRLPFEGRRRHPRHRGEVCRQSGDRQRLSLFPSRRAQDAADSDPSLHGRTIPAPERPVRIRLESRTSRDHQKDRQGAASVPGCRGVGAGDPPALHVQRSRQHHGDTASHVDGVGLQGRLSQHGGERLDVPSDDPYARARLSGPGGT